MDVEKFELKKLLPTFEFIRLIELVHSYNKEEIEDIRKAYKFAAMHHEGQYRQSGEPYITHPINVAIILASMHADKDTVIAGLLHDVLEDTNATPQDIIDNFGQDVLTLVDGVTKLSKMNFSSKQDREVANTRKIILGITKDVRIIVIKLADRLHNMRTLEYKSEFKQKENSLETLEIFSPLAYAIGAYKIKGELEDLSLKYLKPEEYKKVEDILNENQNEYDTVLKTMLGEIEYLLNSRSIPHELKIRTKNIYGIYKKLSEGSKMNDIHDLLALKVIVDSIDECYRSLGIVHAKYHPVNEMFKDFICNPKTNKYQSIHSTVFGPKERLVQVQFRTFDMDKVATYGLPAYWDINRGEARIRMQEDIRSRYQFMSPLTEMNGMFKDNEEFVSEVKRELFGDKIYVFTTKGDIIELPKGSTAIDFAYKIHTEIGDKMTGVIINDEEEPVDIELHTNDRVKVIVDANSTGPKLEWLNKVKTSRARKRINENARA